MWFPLIDPAIAADTVQHAVVKSVYDGDTLTLADGTKVRLRHVNTPELKPGETYAAEARDLVTGLVLGREVEVIGEGERDRYGRLMASIRIDGVDVATRLVESGLAHVFLVPPRMPDVPDLLAEQAEARLAARGLWGPGGIAGPLHLTSFHANGGQDVTDPNSEYFRLCNVSDRPLDLSGWTAGDGSGRTFAMPLVTLPPGAAVAVHSGIGADSVADGHLYLGSPLALWPDEGARLVIRNPQGADVSTRTP